MSRTFNLSKHLNTREARDVYSPLSDKMRQKMTPEQAEKYSPLPVPPFNELVEEVLGKKVEQIDQQIIKELVDYYLDIFSSPEMIGPAFESVKSLTIDVEPNKKIEQLRAALAKLNSDKSATDILMLVKQAFGDDLAQLEKFKRLVFSKFNLEYDESLIAIFKQRVNKKTVPEILALYEKGKEAGEENTEVLMVASQLREEYVSAAAQYYSDFYELCESYGLNQAQITWLITHGKDAKPTQMPFFEKANVSEEIIRNLLYENHTILVNIGRNFNENPALLFNQNVKAMTEAGFSEQQISTMLEIGKQVGGEIARDEYLEAAGISRLEIPEDVQDLFDTTYDPKLPMPPKEQIRNNPKVLRLVKSLLKKGGYIVGSKAVKRLPSFLGERKSSFELKPEELKQIQDLIGQGKTVVNDIEDFPAGGWVDRALWYAASTLSENMDNFKEMVLSSASVSDSDSDGEVYVEDDGSEKSMTSSDQLDVLFGKEILRDEKYGDFNFIHDAKDQKRAVDMLRNMFGLEVVPSKMGIPALDDCNINVEGFLIDFIVICSALKNWQNVNNDFHPLIDEQVNFVGEYYGFNFDFKKSLRLFEDDGSIAKSIIDTETGKQKSVTRVEHPEGITMPDGSLAKVSLRRNPGDANKSKISMDASYNTPIDSGSAYKIRTQWKKMTEDFAATITGNAAIHIPADFKEIDLIQELNKCNILYKYQNNLVNNSPQYFVENHSSKCTLPECDSKKVSSTGEKVFSRQYSVKEAMVISKIIEFKMTHGLVPKLREEKAKTAAAKREFKNKIASQLNTNAADLWKSISYQEFLQKFHDEHELGVKGFGRHEVYQYFSQKSALEEKVIQLRNSPNYDINQEIEIRNQINELKTKYLQYFQQIFDSHPQGESDESIFYKETLKKLEDLRTSVANGEDNLTNQQLITYLNQISAAYVPQVEAQKKKPIISSSILFKIAIQS